MNMQRFTPSERSEAWDRIPAGETAASIAASFGRYPSAIRAVMLATGGIPPTERRRADRVLTLAEWEEISRGVAAGESLRSIAGRIGRAPSTVSRELGG